LHLFRVYENDNKAFKVGGEIMRAVVQRVKEARVDVDGATVGEIGPGVLVLLGIGDEDTEKDCQYLADKISNLRIFPDEKAEMNRSIVDKGYSALVVSQFTLWGDCRKGRRPSFSKAARPEKAEPLYEKFVEMLRAKGVEVATGRFQAMMEVYLVNHGPVTILLDSQKKF